MGKIQCTLRRKKKIDEDVNCKENFKITEENVECERLKIFLQLGKAEINEKDIVDTVFIHYRDHKGRPVQLKLKENPQITQKIREIVHQNFGELRITGTGNLSSFDERQAIEYVINSDSTYFERNRFECFVFKKAEKGLWKFNPIEKKTEKPRIRRLTIDEEDIVKNVESNLNKRSSHDLGKLVDVCPLLESIDTEKIARNL